MEQIVLRFPAHPTSSNPMYNEVLRNTDVLRHMRSRGIPVVGKISVLGVERGTLSVQLDTDFDEFVYTWLTGDDDDPAAGL